MIGFYALLSLLCVGLAWFDFKTKRIPNLVTVPMLGAGIWLHFPGSPSILLASILLVLSWRSSWLGGGDVKLWLGILWLAAARVPGAAVAMGEIWIGTSAAQLAWRFLQKQRVLGVRLPGAWRTLPFVAWLILVS
jgi:Flp pilus assembly protein protease CpaA